MAYTPTPPRAEPFVIDFSGLPDPAIEWLFLQADQKLRAEDKDMERILSHSPEGPMKVQYRQWHEGLKATIESFDKSAVTITIHPDASPGACRYLATALRQGLRLGYDDREKYAVNFARVSKRIQELEELGA